MNPVVDDDCGGEGAPVKGPGRGRHPAGGAGTLAGGAGTLAGGAGTLAGGGGTLAGGAGALPVRVPREVYQGIEAVRRSGLTNMLDRPTVAGLARGMGYAEASRWVRRHRDLYARAIFQGLEVEGEDGDGRSLRRTRRESARRECEREVTMASHGRRLDAIWVVSDPTEMSELADVCSKMTPESLAACVRGGMEVNANTAFYDHEGAARADAETRIRARRAYDSALRAAREGSGSTT